MSKPAEIETPEAMAAWLYPDDSSPLSGIARYYRFGARGGIEARDEQIATWCEEHAAAAEREAEEHERGPVRDDGSEAEYVSKMQRVERCEGQASAWRGLAALLRGAT